MIHIFSVAIGAKARLVELAGENLRLLLGVVIDLSGKGEIHCVVYQTGRVQ
jgi:hypothetical protein